MFVRYLLPCLIIMSLLSSCSRGRWLYETTVDSIKKNDSLKAYIASTKKKKIVLRLPSNPKEITQTELRDRLISYLEELLLQENIIVRDRSLLLKISEGGIFSYTELGKRIDTDIFIEIVNFNPNTECARGAHWINEDTGQKTFYPDMIQYCATLECKIILVRTGEVGGMFRFNEFYPNAENNMVYNNATGIYEHLPSYSQQSEVAGKIFNRFINALLTNESKERKRYKDEDKPKINNGQATIADIPHNVRSEVLKEMSIDDIKKVIQGMSKESAQRLTAKSVRAIYNFNQGMKKK